MIENNNNEKISIFLSTLTDEEQDMIPTLISSMRKKVKEQDKQAKVNAAIEMYAELNILEQRMYTIAQCAKHNRISKNALSKALQDLEDGTDDESPVEEVIEATEEVRDV